MTESINGWREKSGVRAWEFQQSLSVKTSNPLSLNQRAIHPEADFYQCIDEKRGGMPGR
jgi:hypothetical protein